MSLSTTPALSASREVPMPLPPAFPYAHRGEDGRIHRKTPGDRVRGNPLRHPPANGTGARGAARHIGSAGPAPRWC
ncbi:hypothetical protein AB0O68_07035 [Streptomyces sp. NPDC087512]|uniref:hypothetical protein n=1 Tax=Streptomyces sp. NPDC087512 TaxID=3155059 RepID=UPI00343A3B18